jgi:hypothetical protein
MQEKQVQNAAVGYLCFQSVQDEEWAAMLVVEPGGLPQEFLYSGPLRPTPVQEILYQDALVGQARLSLVRSLLRGLRSKPVFVAVRADDADAAWAAEIRSSILLLNAPAEWLSEPSAAAAGALQRLEETVGVSEPMGRAIAALAYVVEYERRSKEKPGE